MRVAIVVDPSSAELDELSREMPVWAVESPHNRAAAQQFWKQSSRPDLTLYDVQNTNARELNAVNVIDIVELHHPHVTSVLLVGVAETQSLKLGLLEMGYTLAHENGRIVGHRGPGKPAPY
jgi:hypothetical protein